MEVWDRVWAVSRPRRKTGLRRSGPIRRKTGLRPSPLRREGRRARSRRSTWSEITRQAIVLAGGACQFAIPDVCTGRAEAGHHRLPRAQGGPDALSNCVPGCHACHQYVTDHPAWAYERGFTLRRSGPHTQGGAQC